MYYDTPVHPSVLGLFRRLEEWCKECEKMKCLNQDHDDWADRDCEGCVFWHDDFCEVAQ